MFSFQMLKEKNRVFKKCVIVYCFEQHLIENLFYSNNLIVLVYQICTRFIRYGWPLVRIKLCFQFSFSVGFTYIKLSQTTNSFANLQFFYKGLEVEIQWMQTSVHSCLSTPVLSYCQKLQTRPSLEFNIIIASVLLYFLYSIFHASMKPMNYLYTKQQYCLLI